MTKSIISMEYECVVCGRTTNLHRHHVFFGQKNHDPSEREGCWVYLCPRHHNASNYGVHVNHALDLKLKRMCQKKWMEVNNRTIEDFISVFGRNYLE